MALPKFTIEALRHESVVFMFTGIVSVMIFKAPIFNWENYFRLRSNSIRKQATN